MTYFDNISNLTDFLIASNSASQGIFGYTIAILLWMVMFLGTMPFGRGKAMMFASFMSAIITMFLGNLGLVPYWVLIGDGLLFALGTGINHFSKKL